MSKILFASNNTSKLREATAILEPYGFEIVSPESIGMNLEVPEVGLTYLENASLKATKFFKVAKIPCIADDSGLEVEALQGAPGVYSHRFAGSGAKTDVERCQFLLDKLRPFPEPWRAAFQCYTVFYDGNLLEYSHGICQGQIVNQARGSKGFGYDPIFKLEDYPLTMAEADEDLKNQVSHRADALKKLIPFLKQYFRT